MNMYLQTSGTLTWKANGFSGKEIRKVRSTTVWKPLSEKKASRPEHRQDNQSNLKIGRTEQLPKTKRPYLKCSTSSVTEHTNQNEIALHAHYTASARSQGAREELMKI